MSTLTGLVGGGGTAVVSSLPITGTLWQSPFTCRITTNSSLQDLLNISGASGYLLSASVTVVSPLDTFARCIITVDGTTIADKHLYAGADDAILSFWPPSNGFWTRSTTSVVEGNPFTSAFPLRFESSLRVRISGVIGTVEGVHVLT